MLELQVAGVELYDEKSGEFLVTESCTLQLEHSLAAISKWEAKTHKSFLNSAKSRTIPEFIEYIRCMSLNEVDPRVFMGLKSEHIKRVADYINEPMTATTITRRGGTRGGREIVTAEILYWQMITLGIPFECQYWHLNRLLMLIGVCDEKSKRHNKMSRREILSNNAALNAARRAKTGSKG